MVENLTLLGETTINLPDQALTIVSVPVEGTVPAGSALVVELFTPSGLNDGNSFYIGSNNLGQTDASYLRTATCGISQPRDLASIGFPGMQIVMNVTGRVHRNDCTSSDIPWASVSPANGTIEAGASDEVSVTYDSSGLSDGTYTGRLCIETNDPEQLVVEVPLTLNVATIPDIDVETTSLPAIQLTDQTTQRTLSIDNLGAAPLTWSLFEQLRAPRLPNKPLLEVPQIERIEREPQEGDDGVQIGAVYRRDGDDLVAQPPARMAETGMSNEIITHSNAQEVMPINPIACVENQYHTDNSYYRVFELNEFGINEEFQVTSVEFGVYQAIGAEGEQPVHVRLHLLDGSFLLQNMRLIGAASIQLPDQALTKVSVPVTGKVPAGGTLVVELFTPDGRPLTSNRFAIGSNNLGQTAASYLRAPDCNYNEPTDFANVGSGYPDLHIVMNVYGNLNRSACTPDEELTWLTLSPAAGTTAPNNSSDVTVTFDSAGLPNGIVSGNLCIESNDPDEPVVEVPVALIVGSDCGGVICYVWDGGGLSEYWLDRNNWLFDLMPLATQPVLFNDISDKNATLGDSITTAGLLMTSGYDGTISQNNHPLTINGDFTQASGTFNGGTEGRSQNANSPLTITGTFSLQGGTFNAPAGQMSISGDFEHTSGTFEPNGGTVLFDGAGEQTLIADNTPFNNLIVGENSNLTVSGTLAISGTLTNNGQINTVPSSASPGNGTATFNGPEGHINVELTGSNLGTTTVQVMLGNSFPTGGFNTNCPLVSDAVQRYFNITPSSNGPAIVRLYYKASELNGNDVTRLTLWHCDGSEWHLLSGTPIRGSAGTFDYVELAGITDFSPFMLRYDGLMAVDLAAFEAITEANHIKITWQTVSELNNLGFNLYRAEVTDTQEVPATWTEQLNPSLIPAQAPGSGQGAAYEWQDDELTMGTTYVYWLEDVDMSGIRTMHGPVSARYVPATALRVHIFNVTSSRSATLWGALLLLGAVLLSGVLYWRRGARSSLMS